jgi:hypothetical protein
MESNRSPGAKGNGCPTRSRLWRNGTRHDDGPGRARRRRGCAANDNATAGAGQGGGRRGGGRQLSPAAQDLQQAIEAKAPADEIKAKLAKYREDRQQKEANLQKAQDDLKKVLNSRQEATAVLMGLLN